MLWAMTNIWHSCVFPSYLLVFVQKIISIVSLSIKKNNMRFAHKNVHICIFTHIHHITSSIKYKKTDLTDIIHSLYGKITNRSEMYEGLWFKKNSLSCFDLDYWHEIIVKIPITWCLEKCRQKLLEIQQSLALNHHFSIVKQHAGIRNI